MSWNYRVVRKVHPATPGVAESEPEDELAIHEVYYREAAPHDPEGETPPYVTAWSEDAMAPHGETLEELRDALGRMLDALDKPILDEADLKAEMERRSPKGS